MLSGISQNVYLPYASPYFLLCLRYALYTLKILINFIAWILMLTYLSIYDMNNDFYLVFYSYTYVLEYSECSIRMYWVSIHMNALKSIVTRKLPFKINPELFYIVLTPIITHIGSYWISPCSQRNVNYIVAINISYILHQNHCLL